MIQLIVNLQSIRIVSVFLLISLLISGLSAQNLEVDGDVSIDGRITDVSDPVDAQDAATKAYVDQIVIDFAFATVTDTAQTVQALLDIGIEPIVLLNEGIDTTHFIGRNYAGGIIFYMRNDGTGFIAAPPFWTQSSSPDSVAAWGCSGTVIAGADSTALGYGEQNTIDILNDCSTVGIAAAVCANLDFNGFDDWYLPSKDELLEMNFNIGKGASGANQNIGGFLGSLYWSSSEFNPFSAWWVDFAFANGNPAPNSKSFFLRVRPMRSF